MEQTPADRAPSSKLSTLTSRLRALTPLQLGVAYLVLHLTSGGVDSMVVSFGSVQAGVVLPAWGALVALLAFVRDDSPMDAGVLVAVAAASAALISLLLIVVSAEFTQPTMSALLFSYFMLPVSLGVAAGVNAAVVVWFVRLAQRVAAERRARSRSNSV